MTLACSGLGRQAQLARSASEITLLQIVEAVDGASAPYECREIRQQGRGALPADECQNPCILAEKMAEAHEAWRNSLATTSLAEIIAALAGLGLTTHSALCSL